MAPTNPFRHRIERTRNKHSRAVCRGDTIVIRLAKNLTREEEREHIISLLRRMTQLVLVEQQKKVIHPFRHLLNGGQTATIRLGDGRKYRFTLQAALRTRATRTNDGWLIKIGPSLRRKTLHRLLWNCIAASEKERLTRRVHELNAQTFDVNIREVRVRFASSQWGSCSTRGVIMLNTALLCLPPSLLNYVIVHELAHCLVRDHSDRFWQTVASVMPRYQTSVKNLKLYRLPQL